MPPKQTIRHAGSFSPAHYTQLGQARPMARDTTVHLPQLTTNITFFLTYLTDKLAQINHLLSQLRLTKYSFCPHARPCSAQKLPAPDSVWAQNYDGLPSLLVNPVLTVY